MKKSKILSSVLILIVCIACVNNAIFATDCEYEQIPLEVNAVPRTENVSTQINNPEDKKSLQSFESNEEENELDNQKSVAPITIPKPSESEANSNFNDIEANENVLNETNHGIAEIKEKNRVDSINIVISVGFIIIVFLITIFKRKNKN